MFYHQNSSLKQAAARVILYQFFLLVGLTLLMWILNGAQKSLSAFLGEMAYWIPTGLCAWRVFARAGIQSIQRFMLTFFLGEGFKLFMSALLLILIINHLAVHKIFTFLGYFAAIMMSWIVSIFCLSSPTRVCRS